MPKKLTYEFVKGSFEKEGYELLSSEYVNSKTKLKYICPEGHRHNITWQNWSANHRCPSCAGNIKLHIEFIKKSFEDEGYTLLSEEYINNRQKLNYTCPNGHEHGTTWFNWSTGHRCPYCTGQGKSTIEDVKLAFKLEGYILKSNVYVNINTKLECVCPNGHETSMTFGNFKQGYRCKYCAGNVRHDIYYIKNEFEKEGYVLLSKNYVNNKTKLSYRCSFGHVHYITWSDWKTGYRCPTCWSIRISGSGNNSWKGGISFEPYCEAWKDQEYKQDIRDRDGNKCLNPYCNSKNPNDLTIHHVDYNKKNCSPSNLITVCRSCNSKANKDRNWHKAWYRAVLNKRYNYNY